MTSTTFAAASHTLATRVVVVHGYGATTNSHWFPWLRDTLAARDISVENVRLPTPRTPDADAWDKAVGDVIGAVDAGTVLVGHSLGCITILRHLAALPEPWVLGGLVLVAGFTGKLDTLPVLDRFLEDDVALDRVVENTRRRTVIRSDDDAVVPVVASDALAERLRAQVHVVPGAGHFRAIDNVTELPIVAQVI